ALPLGERLAAERGPLRRAAADPGGGGWAGRRGGRSRGLPARGRHGAKRPRVLAVLRRDELQLAGLVRPQLGRGTRARRQGVRLRGDALPGELVLAGWWHGGVVVGLADPERAAAQGQQRGGGQPGADDLPPGQR